MIFYFADLEADGLLDSITQIWCFGFMRKDTEDIYIFCNLENLEVPKREIFEKRGIKFFQLEKAVDLLLSPKTSGISWHNFQGYDGEVIKKFYGLDYTTKSIGNKFLEIEDTLVISRGLNPERRLPKDCPKSLLNVETGKNEKIGIHSLEAWGWRTGHRKLSVYDWRTKPLDVYIERVISDLYIQKDTHYALMKEMEDVALSNGKKKGDWKLPMRMQTEVYRLQCKQERTGVLFDIEGAKALHRRINKEMSEIEAVVEPKLGERELPSSDQPNPPKQPWKKPFNFKQIWTTTGKLRKPVADYLIKLGYTDEAAREKLMEKLDSPEAIEACLPRHPSLLSKIAVDYCAKFGITDISACVEEIERLEKGGSPKKLVEKLKLQHKKDVKVFLMKNGWVPTLWKTRNILTHQKTKQKLKEEEVEKKYNDYIKEFKDSVYWPFILKDLGYKSTRVDTESESFKAKVLRQGRQLLSAPQYKDQRGVRCPNLKRLADDDSKLIIKWLSLQNRKNTILSDNGTGWLTHPRLEVDGRLPARSSGLTPTYRQRHSVIVNLPKPAPDVIMGKEMRSLFIAPEGYYNVGCDACGIEQRVAGHFAYTFDNGVYAESLLFGDAHSANAKAYSEAVQKEITRSQGKNISYAILYGAQAQKIAVMASVEPVLGQKLIDAFWDTNYGLKAAKEALIAYWEATGKKYVMGIDGRKIRTRSAHSIMNSLFQSTGAIIMDFAACWSGQRIEQLKLDAERWGFFHDELQWYHSKKEIEVVSFPATPEAQLIDVDGKPIKRKEDVLKPEQEREGRLWSAAKFDEENCQWVQYYSQVGELIARGIEAAGKYFKMNLPFPGEYMVGSNFAESH